MTERPGVTLQISLAAPDARLAPHNLAHLMRQLGHQVDEVLFTIDLPRNAVGPEAAAAAVQPLRDAAAAASADLPNVRIETVDYSPESVQSISRMFFRGRDFPTHDYRNKAIYPYFFGLNTASHDYVLHVDSDMLFGGGSQSWVTEAVELLRSRPDVVLVSPLPGPPTEDGELRSQRAEREPLDSLAFRFHHMSTRLFLVERSELAERLGDLRPKFVPLRPMTKAVLLGRKPYQGAEDTLSRTMAERGQLRIDFLGRAPGLWSVHPLNHTEEYHTHLPEMIRRIEAGEVPEGLRGMSDITDPLLAEWFELGAHARPPIAAR